MNNEIVVEIKESLGVIRKNGNGWTRELNIVSWNGSVPRYDIREWSPDHTRMTRGITLTRDELDTITQLFKSHTEGDEK